MIRYVPFQVCQAAKLDTVFMPAHAMDSEDGERGLCGRLWSVAKENPAITVPVTVLVSTVLVVYVLTKGRQTSSLKVYNMSDRVVIGKTDPITKTDKQNNKQCGIAPYQSFFESNAVTFTLVNHGIQTFFWHGIIGPTYNFRVVTLCRLCALGRTYCWHGYFTVKDFVCSWRIKDKPIESRIRIGITKCFCSRSYEWSTRQRDW